MRSLVLFAVPAFSAAANTNSSSTANTCRVTTRPSIHRRRRTRKARRTATFRSSATTEIENIPPGFRGRETYRFNGPDEFTETFEMAEPGKDFELYAKATLKRVK